MNRLEKVFLFTVIVLLFQITRNINTVLYISVLFMSYLFLYILLLFRKNLANGYRIDITLKPMALVFLLSLMAIPFISLAQMELGDFLIALPRYFVTFPFILFCILYSEFSYILIMKVLRALIIFMTLASLSIPFQMIFGKISFLTDSSYREGLERYTSLAGSLTALGTLGGFSLAILLFSGELLFRRDRKNTLIIMLVLGMLMSLQKAAIANIIICIFLYILINGESNVARRVATVISLSTLIYACYYILKDTEFSLYIQSLIFYSFSDNSLGMEQDLYNRIWERPNSVIQYHDFGIINFISGIGFSSLSGIMGLPKFPMAHNNYFDLIFSGGIIHFFSYLFLLLSVPIKAINKRMKGIKLNEIDRGYSICVLLILVNMMIGAANFYQPIVAVFIFFIVFSYNPNANSLNIKSTAINI